MVTESQVSARFKWGKLPPDWWIVLIARCRPPQIAVLVLLLAAFSLGMFMGPPPAWLSNAAVTLAFVGIVGRMVTLLSLRLRMVGGPVPALKTAIGFGVLACLMSALVLGCLIGNYAGGDRESGLAGLVAVVFLYIVVVTPSTIRDAGIYVGKGG